MASGYSKQGEEFIGEKMHKTKDEDRPQKQKVAIAMSYARKEGFKVPKKLVDRENKTKNKKTLKGGVPDRTDGRAYPEDNLDRKPSK